MRATWVRTPSLSYSRCQFRGGGVTSAARRLAMLRSGIRPHRYSVLPLFACGLLIACGGGAPTDTGQGGNGGLSGGGASGSGGTSSGGGATATAGAAGSVG